MTGSVKVISNASIGGGLRFDLPHVGEAVAEAGPPISDALFPVRRREGGINTGVAVHNLEEEPMEVSCRLMSGGAVLEQVSIHLSANGQLSWLIDAAFPGVDTSDFAGSVRCDAVGEGLFTTVALEMDPGTRTFITLPVFPVDRFAGGQAAVLDFAHFVNGDGATSDLVFVNPSTQAEPSRHPLYFGHPCNPARYLFLRHRGRARGRRIGGGRHRRSGGPRGRRSDGPGRRWSRWKNSRSRPTAERSW